MAKAKIEKKKEEVKAITVDSVPLETLEKMKSIYHSANFGGVSIIQAWYILRQYTLQEIKGLFEENELYALIDAFNGTIMEVRISTRKEYLRAEMEDSFRFDHTDEKWGINSQNIFKKIDSLTSAQTFFLIERIYEFWNVESGEEKALEKFVKTFF